MVVNKRRKSSRADGSNTHGWGRNKHRKSGSRGGVGNAGTGKKCHANKSRVWGTDYLGKSGFVRKRQQKNVKSISLSDIEDRLPKWKTGKLVKEESGKVVIDLTGMGFTVLLGNGRFITKAKIIVPHAAKSVEGKVSAAGGELVVNKSE